MAELYKHNQEIYDGIISAIADGHHKIGYTEATGLGKSFVFAELCNTVFKNKKILYVVPKLAIQDNMYEYSEIQDLVSNVDFTTFASFNSEDNAIEYAEKYEVIFVDECHHLLSDIQGRTVDLCGTIISEKVGCYYIGMSATIEVGKINVFEKYFTKTIYGLDLYDAIVEGLYPKMKYTIAIPDIQEITEDVRLKYNIDCSKTMLESILSKNKVRKVLVYFSNISELKENIEYIKKVFSGYKIFILHSKNKCNSGILREFNEYTGDCVMLSVSMLLEGVHVSDVDCAIIDRNIAKIHTLLQLIGRLYHYGMESSPLVIDMYNSVKLFVKNEHIAYPNGYKNIDRSIRDIVTPFCLGYNIIDFVTDYLACKKSKMLLKEDYRGVMSGFYSVKDISTLLCTPYDAVEFYYARHIRGSKVVIEGLIDYCLDVYKKPRGRKTLDEIYRGIKPCKTLVELSKELGVTEGRMGYALKTQQSCIVDGVVDFKGIIDYFLDKGKNKYVLDKEYRGIKPCSSLKGVIEQCGLPYRIVNQATRRYVKESGNSDIHSIIDFLLSYSYKERSKAICCGEYLFLDKEYRGIKPFDTVKQLASQLGCSQTVIIKRKKSLGSCSTKELIDCILDS